MKRKNIDENNIDEDVMNIDDFSQLVSWTSAINLFDESFHLDQAMIVKWSVVEKTSLSFQVSMTKWSRLSSIVDDLSSSIVFFFYPKTKTKTKMQTKTNEVR